MSITGYQGGNYKDLVSGTTGAAASSIAPTPNLSTATANTQETLAWNTYHSQRALMDWARQQDRSKRSFELGVRSLPAAYNRRGMLDSGTLKRDTGRAYGDQLRNLGRIELALQDALAGSEFQIQGAGRTMDQSVFDGLMSAAQRRAAMASQIKAAS